MILCGFLAFELRRKQMPTGQGLRHFIRFLRSFVAATTTNGKHAFLYAWTNKTNKFGNRFKSIGFWVRAENARITHLGDMTTEQLGDGRIHWGNRVVAVILALAASGVLGINTAMDYRFGCGPFV
jgi:hypothetical protein